MSLRLLVEVVVATLAVLCLAIAVNALIELRKLNRYEKLEWAMLQEERKN